MPALISNLNVMSDAIKILGGIVRDFVVFNAT
jgi:hypothetical protein